MMHQHIMGEGIPKFYGATTLGERGQIVVPAEARKDLDLSPSTKIMVFGAPMGEGLLIVKADSIAEMLARANRMLSGVEEVLKSSKGELT
jgi:AbrB family looped-hinge helix DNA binding protein